MGVVTMLVDKDLLERVHNFCGLPFNLDLNALKNILRLGLQSVCKTCRCLIEMKGAVTGQKKNFLGQMKLFHFVL